MEITNITGLPQSFVNAANWTWYDNPVGDSTTTRLIKPPRIVALFNRHKDKIKVDVQEMAWTLLGGAVHLLLEKSASEEVIVETRIHTRISDWRISGKPDAYYPKTKHIDDFKVTSVVAFQMDKPEWEQQLNLNAMMHRLKGQEVNSHQIICVLRDWIRSKSLVSESYPQHAIQAFGLPVWPQQQCKDFAVERVTLHQSVLDLPDNELPLCTPEERWYRGEKWAIYKTDGTTNNKNAAIVADSKEEALSRAAAKPIEPPKKGKAKFYSEPIQRPGQNIRCLDWCEARHFCDFGIKVMAERDAQLQAKESLVNENEEE